MCASLGIGKTRKGQEPRIHFHLSVNLRVGVCRIMGYEIVVRTNCGDGFKHQIKSVRDDDDEEEEEELKQGTQAAVTYLLVKRRPMQKLPRQRSKVHFLEMEPRSTSSSPPPAPPSPPPPLLLLLKLIFFVSTLLNLFPNHSRLLLSLSKTPVMLSLSISSVGGGGGSSGPNCSSLAETS